MPSLFCEQVCRSSSPYINHFLQPDTIIPDPANPQSWNRYSYVQNNPIRYNDPTGHVQETDGDGGGKCDLKCLKNNTAKGKGSDKSKTDVFYSFDGGWNDPQYSTWNLLRNGSGCTACHVTHWTGTIPTNSEIDPSLVSYYRSLDKTAHQIHWAAFINVSTYSTLARETIVIGHYNQNPSYIDIARKTGANYFQLENGLTAEQVAAQNEKFIVDGVQSGCRFVQCSAPVRPGSGLENEIGWLEQNGYSVGADMSTGIATSFFNSAAALFGFTSDN